LTDGLFLSPVIQLRGPDAEEMSGGVLAVKGNGPGEIDLITELSRIRSKSSGFKGVGAERALREVGQPDAVVD
jgi:hypothetical protein